MMAEITDFARRRITPFTINQMVRIASAAETDSEQHEKNLIASAQVRRHIFCVACPASFPASTPTLGIAIA
jgi:hypothetical protein